jgi:maltose/moltooligosaccharide transporter
VPLLAILPCKMNSPRVGPADSGEAAVYRVGTLSYTRQGLYVLFFWLMWNDFSITLLEQVGGLVGFLYKDLGSSDFEMASFGSISGLISMWINPWFSTWSDRTRTKYGRRRPFVLFATPFFALFMMLIPYMPTFYRGLVRYPMAAEIFHHLPIKGELFCIFVCGFIAGVFNAMVLAIFSYLYWDVVPANVMGRFNSLAKMVTVLASFIWSFFLLGLGEHHMKSVFVGVSLFCLVFYMISTWQVKEGEYPPPDEHKKGGAFAPIRAYFVECFSEPYFIWIFFGFTLYQLNNLSGQYRGFYLHYDLGMSLGTIGRIGGISQALCLVVGYAIGSMTDKLNPVRLMSPVLLIWGIVSMVSFFVVRGEWSYLAMSALGGVVIFAYGVITAAFTVRVYPMEKLGQFCAASAISSQLVCNLMSPWVGALFDFTSNRVAFLWSGCCLFASALVFRKVHRNWLARHQHAPLPHAG